MQKDNISVSARTYKMLVLRTFAVIASNHFDKHHCRFRFRTSDKGCYPERSSNLYSNYLLIFFLCRLVFKKFKSIEVVWVPIGKKSRHLVNLILKRILN